ncbi:MAG TPA: copper transporter [Solirubrobacterales bacterium]|nr:copper transporter [Solirubrobacterales bacterium]
MGYSARYHATSLIAVFLALAIGILIGAEFGGDALTSTRKNLEASLVGNLQDARSRADDLSGQLGRSNEFADRVYPVLVRDRLQGKRIAIVALGGLPGEVTSAVEDALGPTGARLVGVGVVREPVDVNGLAEDLSKTRFADLRTNPDALTALGTGVGRQLVIGGTLPEVVRGQLFSRASGSFGALDGVIVVRDEPQDMGPVQRGRAGQLEAALMAGVTGTREPAVGVETSTAEPSSISFFQANDLSSVDDVEMTAGHVALVFAMLGAEGSFGVKSSADRLLPDLLAPAPGH